MKILLNPDKNKAAAVRQKVKDNNGYCPCSIIKDETTKCPCKDFREQTCEGECHCGLFIKQNEVG